MRIIQKPSKEALLKNALQSFEIEGISISPEKAQTVAQRVAIRLKK